MLNNPNYTIDYRWNHLKLDLIDICNLNLINYSQNIDQSKNSNLWSNSQIELFTLNILPIE